MLLLMTSGLAAAESYDRSLERSVMDIVARKMGDIRGSIETEQRTLAKSPLVLLVSVEPRLEVAVDMSLKTSTAVTDETAVADDFLTGGFIIKQTPLLENAAAHEWRSDPSPVIDKPKIEASPTVGTPVEAEWRPARAHPVRIIPLYAPAP